jgi:hypothetical protein
MVSSSVFSNVGASLVTPASGQVPNLFVSNNLATACCQVRQTTQSTDNKEDTIWQQLVAQLQVTSDHPQLVANCDQSNLRSQNTTSNKGGRGQHRRYLPDSLNNVEQAVPHLGTNSEMSNFKRKIPNPVEFHGVERVLILSNSRELKHSDKLANRGGPQSAKF